MRALGIDIGGRRIGLAVSDRSGTLARPWKAITSSGSRDQAVDALLAAIRGLELEEDGLAQIVFGLPKHLDGTPSKQTASVQSLAQAVAAQTKLPIFFQDERLSSREAESRLALRERDWRARKRRLDAAAAAIILQDFLDSRR